MPQDDKLAYSESDLDRAGIFSRKTRYRLRRDGRFPEPVCVGAKNLYPADKILSWLQDPQEWARENATS